LREIPLKNGGAALVDGEDYERLAVHSWYRTADGYAERSVRISRVKTTHVLMHRVVLGTPTGSDTDHRDGNRLNNTRPNLRVATRSQNIANMPRVGRNKRLSVFRGVTFRRGLSKPWRARIRVNGKYRHLGWFTSDRDAAHAYDRAATTSFGEFAQLNFPRSVATA
jgi:hypothetical protein